MNARDLNKSNRGYNVTFVIDVQTHAMAGMQSEKRKFQTKVLRYVFLIQAFLIPDFHSLGTFLLLLLQFLCSNSLSVADNFVQEHHPST